MMQVLIAIIIGWLVSAVLTYFDLLSSERNSVQFYARTDTQLHVIHSTPWLSFPYPGRLPRLRKLSAGRDRKGRLSALSATPFLILVFASYEYSPSSIEKSSFCPSHQTPCWLVFVQGRILDCLNSIPVHICRSGTLFQITTTASKPSIQKSFLRPENVQNVRSL